jgi:hypothetical protein
MTKASNEKLEGITLEVYLHVLKKGKPVGPREVMKAVNLSSPSVAYRHLQKLEDLGYLQKNEYGEYLLKKKMRFNGYRWIGRRLVPNSMFYFYFFLGLFILEIVVLAIHYAVETYQGKVFFAIGLSITGIAMVLFLIEALSSRKRIGEKKELKNHRLPLNVKLNILSSI